MRTIRDVAQKAGVSVATVSYVVNGTRNVAAGTEARVRSAMKSLDYYPNAIARSLKTKRTQVLGAVISDIVNPFFSRLVRGAEDCARENGYGLLICNTSETLLHERSYLSLLRENRVDGLLLAPTGKNEEMIAELLERGMHIVLLDRQVSNVQAPAVLSHNVQGAYRATTFLIEQGHKDIGIVLGLQNVSTTRERLNGYCEALVKHGLELNQSRIVYGRSEVIGAQDACYELLERRPRPTALFTTNNFMTIGAIRAINELGLCCPEDISLVGFDDFEWAEAFSPPLTVVTQHPYRMGYQAVRLLLNRITKGSKATNTEVRIDVGMKIRGSVAQPSTSKGADAC